MSILNNFLLSVDSYKMSHFAQLPKGTTKVSSYVEARGSKIEGCNEIVFFGPQSYIKERLLRPITMQDVREANNFSIAHGVPFNLAGWEYIVREHKGFLPLSIRSVPEGTVVPTSQLLATIVNTDDNCAWLTSYVETDYLRAAWYGSTVATVSREIKKIILAALEHTADNPEIEIMFKLHDFGDRGVSSNESAGIGGAAHLINFLGTDTIPGIGHAMEYYNSDVCGFSISASEHSTMTIEGREGEFAAYTRMVDEYAKPGAMFACVIDSYDWRAAIDMWVDGGLLKRVKDAGAKVILRPDSGHPVHTPIQVILMLCEKLKDEIIVNSKGFKVLPDYVRVIQGDGIDIKDVKEILELMDENHQLSASNIAFGMGGGLLQKVNRDTFKFAMKASYACINGKDVDVYKEPMGQADKKSKKGINELYRNVVTKELKTLNIREVTRSFDAELGDIFNDADGNTYTIATELMYHAYKGTLITNFTTFEEVRARARL